jgi:hypothetical protein
VLNGLERDGGGTLGVDTEMEAIVFEGVYPRYGARLPQRRVLARSG